MAKYKLNDMVNELAKFYNEMDTKKHGYKACYNSTGFLNFEKAYIDMERAQRYLKRSLTIEPPTRFIPVNKVICIVLGIPLEVLMSFYYLRSIAHAQVGYNKYKGY